MFGVDSQENDNMLPLGKYNIKFNNKTVNVKAPYKTNIGATKSRIVLSLHIMDKTAIFLLMVEK